MAGTGGKRPGAGRKPGNPTRVTYDLKKYVLDTAEALHAAGRGLDVWAKDNERDFWTVLFKTMIPKPLEVSGPGGDAIPILHRHEIVYVKPRKTDAPDE